ncbi:protein translocase subunit SecD [Lacrimispora sp. NSJ-141]|uniref:Multifunctional fusion protein n=1 Tax=Lientehia hominis TaxID=2897778 RepID=A0AAP2RJN1_9FIRM|nr:protein translocase subunit SecD [Lientehia hominis]MCD2492090.1 protein translocase subunit SecD [Lientehia hominis]
MKNARKNSTRGKGIACLIVLLAVIGGFIYTAVMGLGKDGSGSMSDIKLGLDLAGGVSITYQTVDENPSDTDMKDTIYKLKLRVDAYSPEAEVYQEGSNRINVDIPGVSDANAILEELGQPGSLSFQDADGNVVLTGDDVKTAQPASKKNSTTGVTEYYVSLQLTDEGSGKFATATENMMGKTISIIYDGKTVSSPRVKEKITGGQCSIDGMSSYEEANNLASTIRIGSLPLELKELRSNVVGAKLGEEAISTSLKAGLIGFIIVAALMVFLYWIPGVAAAFALALYVALVIVFLSAFDITLTLPGIAGIILSIGMAVDANVIIFARIREELAAGRKVQAAIKEGFSKALSAIIDGNVTTLIAAAVLLWRGSGTVKGFAQTLALGIVLSMFTALVVTKFALRSLYNIGFQSEKLYGRAKAPSKINFVKKKYICIICSLVVIAAGFAAMGVYAGGEQGSILNYSLEFQGGTSTNVTFNEDLSMETIHSDVVPLVEEVTGDANVETQKVSGSNEVIIKTRTLSVDEREQLNSKLEEAYGVDTESIKADSISATVSSEMKRDAILSVVVATIFMLIYIWFRFKDIRFATSAVLALVHDVLIVLAFYAITKWSVGNTFIACMLTIVGYSINATIVIFDRIRENLKAMGTKAELSEVVNLSINQTLTRSIYTSLTTFIMVFVLFLMGVSSIREFALPLIVGIVCGAYSSVFLTGPIWYLMKTKARKKETK